MDPITLTDPHEIAAYQTWKSTREDRQRKRGKYWLTTEGREEIRETFPAGEYDEGNIVSPLLDAVEDLERRSGLRAFEPPSPPKPEPLRPFGYVMGQILKNEGTEYIQIG